MSAQSRSKELIRLTYCSTATFAESNQSAGIEKEVARILMQSRRNNPKRELGGVLHYGNGYFFQTLEGQRDNVNERYEKIVTDPRHRDVELLSVQRVSDRLFPDWSMKYVAVESQIREMLEKNGMKEFQPYGFDEAFCERLIRCFVEQRDATREPRRQPGNRKPDLPPQKRSIWQRLFGG